MSGAEIPVAMAALEAGTAAAAPAVAAGTTAALGTAAAGAGAAGALGSGAAGAGLLGAEAAGTGMLAADAGATGLMGGEAALAAAPEASGAMAYTTPSIFAEAPVAEGMMPGAYSDVAGEQYAAAHPSSGLMGYGKQAGKAASTYSAVNGAMGGNQPQRPPPQGRPVFQGEAPPIAQQQVQPQENQFARMLQEQRMRARGMLG